MHQRQRGDHRRVLQIDVVVSDLLRQKHALVDDGACREGRHIKFLAMAQAQRLDSVAGTFSDDV